MDRAEIEHHLERARSGDPSAVGALLEGHRLRLRKMVALRLDSRLRGRVDETDVLQDAFLEAVGRMDEYLRRPDMPFYLWLRFITAQRLQALCREHLGAQKRDVRRERPIAGAAYPEATSEALAAQLVGKLTSPSQALARAEMKTRLCQVLESMEPLDREVIALRHFEQLGNAEVAQVLGLSESTASKRYIRAIQRLKHLLAAVPGMSEPSWK
ncbi:MAG: sigma-70 family RNA polymerase sigma factor [Thermoanaerobaculia bacterium]